MAKEKFTAAIELPHADYARQFLGHAVLFIKEFRATFIPGTKVWRDAKKVYFGTTVGGLGVYVDDNDLALNLHVEDINGQRGTTGIWGAADVIRVDEQTSAPPK